MIRRPPRSTQPTTLFPYTTLFRSWPYAYAWRTLKNAGARIAFASDWPVSPIDPILGIQAAVSRKRWAETDPDQSFSLLESIEAYTAEGAYSEFTEDRKGRLIPGFYADLTILSADIETMDIGELDHVHPTTVICGGRVSFSS
jgi:predicted amidohydrolase YtcJ